MSAPDAGRIVAVLCPCCEGSGKARLFDMKCQWCVGSGRVAPPVALRYAGWLDAIATGGFLAGDHDLADAKQMHRAADDVRAFVGRLAPGAISPHHPEISP